MREKTLRRIHFDRLKVSLIIKIVKEMEMREILWIISHNRKDYDGRSSRIEKLERVFKETKVEKAALADEYLRRLTAKKKIRRKAKRKSQEKIPRKIKKQRRGE